MAEKAKTKALIDLKKETADIVLQKIKIFQRDKELDLPPNYSAANALKSAWLILQETKDKDNNPALDVCTTPSIANALLDMVIQGLNPSKDQCYFIVYGNKLILQRSYQGSRAVCLRVNKDLLDVYAEVVYEGDEVEFVIKNGRRIITNHSQKLGNISNDKIVAAYAVAVDKQGEVRRSELMTIDQIIQAWKQSKMKPVNDDGTLKPSSVHFKFKDEMSKRTVINRLAKHIIGASTDEDLVIRSVRRTDEQAIAAEAEAEASEFADSEVIDIEHHTNGDQQAGQDPDKITDEEAAAIKEKEMADALKDADIYDQKATGTGPSF